MATSATGSPCGACKFLRRKCASDCVFAPYFCSEQGPARFAAIHKVFGASNVSKLLLHVPVHDRCEAVVTIAYEAQARIRDPVYGCVAHIFALQQQSVVEPMNRQPEVMWPQRSNKVYLTVTLPDAKDISVKCEGEGMFSFSAVGVNGEPFNFTLQLYGNISPQGCKTKIGLRNILCSVQKEQKGWWKRLLKSEEKPAPYIKVDWKKWCDEDDEESDTDLASEDDVVYTAENQESSDEEVMLYLPDLEKARGT